MLHQGIPLNQNVHNFSIRQNHIRFSDRKVSNQSKRLQQSFSTLIRPGIEPRTSEIATLKPACHQCLQIINNYLNLHLSIIRSTAEHRSHLKRGLRSKPTTTMRVENFPNRTRVLDGDDVESSVQAKVVIGMFLGSYKHFNIFLIPFGNSN